MRDLSQNIKVIRLITPQTQTNVDTAIVSAIIDRAGFDSLTLAIVLGTLTDAGVTSVVLVEDGDASNLSDAAAVDDKYLIGTEVLAAFTQADDLKVSKIGYKGPKRYVRVTVTPTGNAAGDIPIAGVAILGHPNTAPQSTQVV
jgi:hypothetical protein